MAESEDKDKKKPGEGNQGGAPPNQDLLETQAKARDPEEASIAEDAIRGFVKRRMVDWYGQMEAAVDQLEMWILSQGQEARAIFAQRSFFYSLGDHYISELYGIAGGKGTPVMDAIVGEVYNTVSWAQHAEDDPLQFVNYMRRAVRDATWYMRDNVGAVLANQWPQLLDLAAQGSVDFIPALYAMGLPTLNFKPVEFADRLIAHSEAYRRVRAPQKEQAVEQAQGDQKKQEVQQESQKLAFDDDAKKLQQSLTTTAAAG